MRQPQTSYLKPDGGWLSAWETATSCNTRSLLLSATAPAAWAEMAPKARKVAGIRARPPRCQRQFLPETDENKQAARDGLNYEADIKRLLIASP